MNSSIDTNSLLLQLRAMARDAGIPSTDKPSSELTLGADRIEFSKVLENSVQQVNGRSIEATQLRESFEAGNPNVELADVMIAAQKARISFEALTQVRNKMVAAYKEIMSMPL
ncbi:flagellar hook-basal body complex protein FliE [Granulosicoccus antarcticus]|uniref:Flagellar hook-basal body complex protein FliE n=1 Tax=Granulosicoccus antarcticus IMCC3135 TaxID=1192854 RepID=A0A2Z2NK45_9GAMM|nr:flagellar hook-basal body complex protein FliE [Granulosicoccus antarcticus]ASJ71772.1 Flagellar hook-basal body complex protein FliE [Granulosicoccus antarcticus IMCC3135]